MFEPMELTNDAVIKVIGVGGGGGNAVEHMVRERIEGVEFFAVHTENKTQHPIRKLPSKRMSEIPFIKKMNSNRIRFRAENRSKR